MTKSTLTAILIFICATQASVLAQRKAAPGPPPFQITANSTVLYFGKEVRYPSFFRPVSLDTISERPLLFLGPEDSTAIFLVDVPANANPGTFVKSNSIKLVARLSGIGRNGFEWKVQTNNKRWGRYDRNRWNAWGYNGEAMLVFEAHLLVVNRHSLIIGLIDRAATGSGALQAFTSGPMSASFAANQALDDIIASITGETSVMSPGGVPSGSPVRPN